MKSVMIVDENRSTLEMLRSILEKNDFDVITASTSKEAMELLEKRKIDVLLIHPRLPDEDILMPILPNCRGKSLEKAIPINCKEKELVRFIANL